MNPQELKDVDEAVKEAYAEGRDAANAKIAELEHSLSEERNAREKAEADNGWRTAERAELLSRLATITDMRDCAKRGWDDSVHYAGERDSALIIAQTALQFIAGDWPRQTNEGAQSVARKALEQLETALSIQFNRSTTTKGSALIKPTIGRVVWFWSHEHPSSQPYSAQIAFVHSDTMVNLGYLNHNGEARNATSVRLIQEGDERPNHNFCEWMPYQKGQAAKTEALEKQVAGA